MAQEVQRSGKAGRTLDDWVRTSQECRAAEAASGNGSMVM